MTTSLQSLNPVDQSVVGEVPVTAPTEIDALVQKSRQAQRLWAKNDLKSRAKLLKQAAKVSSDWLQELGGLISAEMGKLPVRGLSEAKGCMSSFAHEVDDIAAALATETLRDKRIETKLSYQPFGVCAAITPWNYPVAMIQSQILPALMAGNSVIVKPSEETPLCAQHYVQALQEKLPEDLLLIAHGRDDVGKALVNADVQLIAFTGSRAAGQQILKAAAGDFKRIILELGGKDPMIVLPSADIHSAARFAASNSFENCGQMCVATERIYVHKDIAAKFEQALVEAARSIEVIPGDQQRSKLGPMVAEWQRKSVLTQVQEALDQGATPLHLPSQKAAGYCFPTVLRADDSMSIMQEETFGPVACVRHYDSIDEAINAANRSVYGLGAAVFGAKQDALAVAEQLDVGMVGINKGCFGASGSPWVGAKQSGYGFHSGPYGHRQFAQVKTISYPRG